MRKESEDLIRAANMCDTLAARSARHEAVTFEYGKQLIDMLEKHARVIARLLRAEAIRINRAAPHEPAPPADEAAR